MPNLEMLLTKRLYTLLLLKTSIGAKQLTLRNSLGIKFDMTDSLAFC